MRLITLITEPKDYSQKAIRLYKSLGRVYFWPELTKKNKKAIQKSAHILVTGLKYQINSKWIDEMPNLEVIATNTTGLNHIDLKEAKKRGIKIISLRGQTDFLKNVPSTAEETFALMLSLIRNIPWAFDDVKKGNWNRDKWRGHQLFEKTLGILGFGRLGKIMARYARAFGMEVIACDPYVSGAAMKQRGVRKADMLTLFKKSDVVSLHVLLTDENYNLVKEKHLKMMKPSAYLINTARAELIEKDALLKALKNKWIAGAAVDVLWDEKGNGGHLKKDPLAAYAKNNKNLIIVPHIGGATFEAMEITQEFLAELVVGYFKKCKR
jgi:D-3-phosphoglycerate dehydrogenase